MLQSVMFLPTIMSSAVMGLVFYLLFNAYNGEVNIMLKSLGLISRNVNWPGKDHAMQTLIITAVWGGLGNYMVYFIAGLQQVNKEALESAEIDGCTFYGTFVRVILPLIKPILAVVALFAFRNAWNDYITTLIMTITNPKLQTLTVAVVQLKYSMNAAAEWHIMLAGASIAIIPILIVYALCNKQFIEGLTAGAVKG